MLNHIVLMGRLTRDPELRRTGSGVAAVNFSVACERDFKNKEDEKETDFVDVVAYRNTAEFVSKYFAKGRMMVVSGRLQVRKWQNKEGENRYSTEVLADHVYFGDSKKDESSGNSYGQQYSTPELPAGSAQDDYSANGFDMAEEADELPF